MFTLKTQATSSGCLAKDYHFGVPQNTALHDGNEFRGHHGEESSSFFCPPSEYKQRLYIFPYIFIFVSGFHRHLYARGALISHITL